MHVREKVRLSKSWNARTQQFPLVGSSNTIYINRLNKVHCVESLTTWWNWLPKSKALLERAKMGPRYHAGIRQAESEFGVGWDILFFLFSSLLVLRCFGPQFLWSFGDLVLWSFSLSRPLVIVSCGPIVLWSSGFAVLWSTTPPPPVTTTTRRTTRTTTTTTPTTPTPPPPQTPPPPPPPPPPTTTTTTATTATTTTATTTTTTATTTATTTTATTTTIAKFLNSTLAGFVGNEWRGTAISALSGVAKHIRLVWCFWRWIPFAGGLTLALWHPTKDYKSIQKLALYLRDPESCSMVHAISHWTCPTLFFWCFSVPYLAGLRGLLEVSPSRKSECFWDFKPYSL